MERLCVMSVNCGVCNEDRLADGCGRRDCPQWKPAAPNPIDVLKAQSEKSLEMNRESGAPLIPVLLPKRPAKKG
jgi:hypothetical protein